jgi:hypothetical protein
MHGERVLRILLRSPAQTGHQYNKGLVRRFEDLRGDFKDLRGEVKDLRTELVAFKEVVNGKFRDLDLDLAKLMDRPK